MIDSINNTVYVNKKYLSSQAAVSVKIRAKLMGHWNPESFENKPGYWTSLSLENHYALKVYHAIMANIYRHTNYLLNVWLLLKTNWNAVLLFLGFFHKVVCQKKRIMLIHSFNNKLGSKGKNFVTFLAPSHIQTSHIKHFSEAMVSGLSLLRDVFLQKCLGLCIVPTNPRWSFWKDACWVWELTILKDLR